MSASNNKDYINWNEVVKKEVIGTEGLDLGEVIEVGDNYFIIQKGLLNKKRYVVPKSTFQSFDGDILKVKVTERDLNGYEETTEPGFKDYSTFKSSDMSKEMETSIPVIGENLEVSKKIVEDNVEIIKEPIKETRTVEVELTYEKITIERKSVTETDYDKNRDNSIEGVQGKTDIETPVNSKTQISIPLKREVPVITKKPFVKEEVIIKKKPVKETKVITEEITNEEVRYDDKNIA